MNRVLPFGFDFTFEVGKEDSGTSRIVFENEWEKNDDFVMSYEQAEKFLVASFKEEWERNEFEKIWSWLENHKQAFKDCLIHFGYEFDVDDEEDEEDEYLEVGAGDFISETETTLEDLYGWIAEHETLAEDFENKFGVKIGEE